MRCGSAKRISKVKALGSCAVWVLSKDRVGQGLGALCGSILQPKAWCFGAVEGAVWVRCGFFLHPSFGLVLGWVLRERIKSKEQRVRSKDNKLKLGYTL